jgi:protoporphyrinogen oxidase
MRGWDLITRRKLIASGSSSGLALVVAANGGNSLFAASKDKVKGGDPAAEYLRSFGPIDRTMGDVAPRQFFGDNNTRGHGALWDLESFMKGRSVEGSVEETSVVVIGGGAAGLFSAYNLRKHKPIVLEQAPRLGGNAKGQAWRGIDFSIGSAYIDEPHHGQPMAQYFEELKLKEVLVQRETVDPVEYNGKKYQHFWEGETDPKNKAAYEKVGKCLEDIANEKERQFPFIPSVTPAHLESLKYYDQWSLYEYLCKIAGGPLPAHLDTALEHYCWSTYAGSSREVSAPGALNFLAQEIKPIWCGAGGNSKIVERLISVLMKDVPAANLRTSCLVVDVKVEGSKVLVTYEDGDKKLRQIRAKAAIMSCPKFVAARILRDIEPTRVETIRKLKYRSYMTANLLIDKKMERGIYDIFMIGNGNGDFSDIRKAQDKMNATDFVMANFAQVDAKYNVLTFYRAFPCDNMRAELNQPTAYDSYRKRFEQQIDRDILPLLKLKQKDCVDLRLNLFGHALPLSEKGLYRDDTVTKLRAPFKNRIFFVEQDNWSYPSLQTGATDAALMKADIEKMLV